ncbi:MAG: DUF4097 domain-containing protein [Lachnospiraceae bacterium]|nr:DUF4097 domain-containing protein [Lachnospiraceae bacterium]
MKKFTKGCLMTALVLFFVGLCLCIVCGLLGGFRQLDEINDIKGIPFWYDIDDVKTGVLDHKWKMTGDIDGKEQLPLTADTLGSIEIDVGNCDVLLQNSEDEHVWFLVEGDTNRPYYTIKNDHGRSKLCIENETKHHSKHWKYPNDTLYLWLPENCALEECEISLGAGVMEGIFINAKKIEISVGAGLIDMDGHGLEGDEVTLTVGAGEILAGCVTAEKADFEVEAGHLYIEELLVSREADVDVSAGNCEITGTITGNLDLECEAGYAEMHLTGSEDDHSYEVECGMGDVTVGHHSHGGFASEKTWNSGKDSQFEISCSVGNVIITFDE